MPLEDAQLVINKWRLGENTGSNPVLTTLIKLVYEQPMRWDALIRNESQVAEWLDVSQLHLQVNYHHKSKVGCTETLW